MCVHACVSVRVYECMCEGVSLSVCVWVARSASEPPQKKTTENLLPCLCARVYIHVYICVCARVYIYVYIYMYI